MSEKAANIILGMSVLLFIGWTILVVVVCAVSIAEPKLPGWLPLSGTATAAIALAIGKVTDRKP